jgi:hypothetical protein
LSCNVVRRNVGWCLHARVHALLGPPHSVAEGHIGQLSAVRRIAGCCLCPLMCTLWLCIVVSHLRLNATYVNLQWFAGFGRVGAFVCYYVFCVSLAATCHPVSTKSIWRHWSGVWPQWDLCLPPSVRSSSGGGRMPPTATNF